MGVMGEDRVGLGAPESNQSGTVTAAVSTSAAPHTASQTRSRRRHNSVPPIPASTDRGGMSCW